MSRKAIAIHVIEKGKKNPDNLKEIDSEAQIWETAYWSVADSTAEQLVGGEVYVHRGQKFPSHIGGQIFEYRTEPNGTRKIFRFKANPKLSGVIVETGWGNEKKISWEDNQETKKQSDTDEPKPNFLENDESAFAEGAAAYRLHHTLERDQKIAKRAKQKRLAETGALQCEVCNFDFFKKFGQLGNGYIEAHHSTPVSQLKANRRTKLSELALVCSNCHRMLHRSNPMLDIPGLRQLCDSSDVIAD